MLSMQKIRILFLILLFASSAVAALPTSAPTIVLVHGALFTSSGWYEVQSHLQNAGYNVVTLDVPGRADDGIAAKEVSLVSAASKVCRVVNLQKTPVVLVGHSQGGAIITQALDQCGEKVKALIYVTAVLPLNGETAFDDLSEADNENFNKTVTFDEVNNALHINQAGPLKAMFMADATDAQFNRARHTMVSEPASIGIGVLHYPEKLFLTVPKFYVQATKDNIISLATQKKILTKTQWTKTYIMHTGHSPMVSQSKELAAHLMDSMQNL